MNKQSFLSGLLLATLLMGCGKSGDVTTTIRRPFPPSQNNKVTLQLAGPDVNDQQPIKTVVENFLGQDLSGDLQSIEILFHNESIDIFVSDGLTTTTGEALIIEGLQKQNPSTEHARVYGDSYGVVHFTNDNPQQRLFHVSYENYDETGQVSSSGILGTVFL